jgi:hypothetical protein
MKSASGMFSCLMNQSFASGRVRRDCEAGSIDQQAGVVFSDDRTIGDILILQYFSSCFRNLPTQQGWRSAGVLVAVPEPVKQDNVLSLSRYRVRVGEGHSVTATAVEM